MRSIDDFDIETGGERSHLGDGQIVGPGVVGGEEEGGELGEAEGGNDAHYIGIMAEVEVEGLVYWECVFVAVEGCVDL